MCCYLCQRRRLRTIHHRGMLAVVLAVSDRLRCLQTVQGLQFWVPRRASDRKAFTRQRKPRRRNGVTLCGPPHWTGEPHPAAAVTVELLDVSPSIDAFENLRPICSEYGLPFLRARDIVCLWKPKPRQSRRKRPDHYLPDSEVARLQMVIGDHGWSATMRKGVTEIVLHGARPREAAKLTGENPEILGQNARRVVKELYPDASSPLP